MDRVPPKVSSTASSLIATAVSLVGPEAVRKEIGCSEADFLAYCGSQKDPTWPEIDRLIQLLVREQGKVIAKNRELMAGIRAKRDQS